MTVLASSDLQVGNAHFDMILHDWGLYHANFVINRKIHYHQGWEIHVQQQGSTLFRTEKGSQIIEGPGIFLLEPRLYHSTASLTPDTLRYSFELYLSKNGKGNVFSLYSELFSRIPAILFLPTQDVPDLSRMLNRQIDAEKDLFFKDLISSCLSRILEKLEEQYPYRPDDLEAFLKSGFTEDQKSMAEKKALVSRMINYIEGRANKQLRLQDLADHYHLSTRHIARLLREVENTSFEAIIKRHRIRTVVLELANTEKSLKDISEECGFPTYSNFWNAFKEFYGISPQAYRDQIAEDDLDA